MSVSRSSGKLRIVGWHALNMATKPTCTTASRSCRGKNKHVCIYIYIYILIAIIAGEFALQSYLSHHIT